MIDNTRGWARIKGLQMPEVEALGFYNWFTHWFFQNIFSVELDVLFFATIVFVSSAWMLRKTIKKIPHYLLLLSTFILGVLFWFMSAPETPFKHQKRIPRACTMVLCGDLFVSHFVWQNYA